MGSFIGYSDKFDQRTFQGLEGGALQSQIVPLGVTQDVQERLYRVAIASRNINNKSPLSGDIGTYKLGTNNCGTWAKHILESNQIALPNEAKDWNEGIGLGGKWDTNPRTGGVIEGITQGVCIGGLTARQIGAAARKPKDSWEAGIPSYEPTPPAPPGTPPIGNERGCVDQVTQRRIG
ncbi:MAG: hypothetical protein GY769_18455 [bacterium]|nr:hypothetical protein [bacterium]